MRPPLRVGIAGLGVVGAEVARRLLEDASFIKQKTGGRKITLSAVCARDKNKSRGVDLSSLPWVDTPASLAARDDVDVVVEVVGGADGPAYDGALAALSAGKPLVTANKAMLASHWDELFDLSRKSGAPLLFEASVGAGIPVIRVLRDGLVANRITGITGILNGTCNYILSVMETRGLDFDAALAEAQQKGYAEADPTLDIDGWDSLHKLSVLARLGLGNVDRVGEIPVHGIRSITQKDMEAAKAKGGTIRLIATAKPGQGGRAELKVAPEWIARDHKLAGITDTTNAITIETDAAGPITLTGPGAGAGPTASAVLADLIALAL